jgi:hypothetical protein
VAPPGAIFIDSLWIYTMNRWNPLRARLLVTACAALAGLLLSLSAPAFAQGFQRSAPKDVAPAEMVVTAPPQVTLDGKADRLSPGARIHDFHNRLVLSGGLVGQTVPVVYRRDTLGLVHEVWMLTPDEYAKLGGTRGDSADGHKRFAELLDIIFGSRR